MRNLSLMHFAEEAFPACLLAHAGVFKIRKGHLAHGRIETGSQAYFTTLGDLFGAPLEKT